MLWCSQISIAGTIYPNAEAMVDMVDANADWYRVCMAVKKVQPLKRDLPLTGQLRSVVGCVADELYYDTKHNPSSTDADWGRVRACAFANNDSAVLMMLYANGFGVRRNPPLTLKYACATGGAPAEIWGRVVYLSELHEGDYLTNFDICDHATSGFMGGYCTAMHERQRAKERTDKLAKITRQFNRAELAEFHKLEGAIVAFAKHRGMNETDASGSARAAFSIQATADEMDGFFDLLESLEKGDGPKYKGSELLELDQQLNQYYRQIRAIKGVQEDEPDRLGDTTITKTDVQETQRVWLKYRDAWTRFARVRYPKLDPIALTAYLTKQRVDQLRGFLEEPPTE
jgi:uncharacterized protein YecT (DUF1311 family)